MDTLSYFLSGIFASFAPYNLLMIIVGLTLGIIGGMLPGISSVTTLALFIPFTFSMPPITALMALGSIYMGATYGGSIASILINTPGQPASLATALEGYKMTLKGESKRALDTALISSAYGGVFGGLVLLFFFQPLSAIGLKFGSEAFFWLGLLGMSALATLYPGNVMRSLLAGLIGMAISTVGMDPTAGLPRFTFGFQDLVQGLDMVVVMIGIFSVTQMLNVIDSAAKQLASCSGKSVSLWEVTKYILKRTKLINGCSMLGTFIGILPGAGGTVASILAYNEAKRFSNSREKFGTGFVDGIIAPESANNGSVGGALVPLLSLGIPGSSAAAVIVGGLMAQGISPGPQLLSKSPDIAYAFIASICICSLIMIPLGWIISRGCVKILDLSVKVLVPSVITLSCVGTYALRNSLFDVGVMLIAGGIGYLLHHARIPAGSIALGLVLGPIVEENLVITMMRAKSSASLFDLLVCSPIAFGLMICCIIVLLMPIILEKFKGSNTTTAKEYKLNFNVIKEYHFIILILLCCIAIPFLMETNTFDEESKIYPQFVFIGIIILSLMTMLFSLVTVKTGTVGKPKKINYTSACICFSICLLFYYVMHYLGFYSSMFMTMFCIILYITYYNTKKVCFKDVLYSLGCSFITVCLEYVCFSMLLKVSTDFGLLI